MFTRRMSAVITVVIVALVTLGLLASALPAFSATPAALPQHAQLASTAPEDGSTVDRADEVVLTFSEDVNERFVEMRVQGPDGDEADGDPAVDGRDVTQALPADLPAGEHEVTYRVVSVDGHPVSGTISFTTTQEPQSASPDPSASASAEPSATALPATPDEASPAAAPTAASGTPGWVLPAVLVAFLVLAGAGAALFGRRRSATGSPAGDGEDPTDFTDGPRG